MSHFDTLRYIAVENIERKGEIACNKQFFHFSLLTVLLSPSDLFYDFERCAVKMPEVKLPQVKMSDVKLP